MANTSLNRTMVALLTNNSGGSVAQGDVVIVDSAAAAAFTTSTSGAYINGTVGVVLEPNGIASAAKGTVALSGWVPLINLSSSASLGDVFKTHTVAKQAVSHAAPVVAGDFGEVLGTGTGPAAFLWGTTSQGVGAGGGSSTLASDTDVSIASPADGQLLQYSTSDNKWHNILNPFGKLTAPPLVATWSQHNFTSTTAVDSSAGGIYIVTSDSANAMHVLDRALPATPYTVIARIIPGAYGSQVAMSCGFAIFASASGNGKFFGNSIQSGLQVPSPSVGTIAAYMVSAWQQQTSTNWGFFEWLKVSDDGTNRTYSMSKNGADWLQVYTEASTVGATMNRIGICVESFTATYPMSAWLQAWTGA